MELHFALLVLAALVGMVINARFGWNPVAVIGSISVLILVIPLLGISVQTDPRVAQAMADSYVVRLVEAMPSLLIGDLAGTVATAIYKTFKGLF